MFIKLLTTLEFIPQHRSSQLVGRASISCNCISSGAIAGIVIGSIVGTLLILWLVYTVRASSSTPRAAESSVRRQKRKRRSSRRGSHSTYVSRNGHAYRVTEPSRVYVKPEWGIVPVLGFICSIHEFWEPIEWWLPTLIPDIWDP
jgi:hypothetical protein